ncbi:hypothetical protein V1505DRAFT_358536 [Lipomyces doorenjongii]
MTLSQIISELQESFEQGKTLPVPWRKAQLRNLWHLITDNQDRFINTIQKDLAKPKVQTQVLEIVCVANDIVHCLQNLDQWLQEEMVPTAPPFQYWSPVIRRRPKGNCLILGTWNYPLTLTLLPFVGLIAAGNTGILRPSEYAPHTADLLMELFPKYLDSSCFRCVNGGKEAAIALLEHPFSHILFTGSETVGKDVMKGAAKHLTPVTLELGGRNAVIISDKANVQLAAKRTLWAKFANAGQTCFAPNVAIVLEPVFEEFLANIKETYRDFYKGEAQVRTVGRIVNAAQFQRVQSLLSSTKGNVVLGGRVDDNQLFVEPTVVTGLLEDDVLLQSEIFGPILPIVRAVDIDHAKALAKTIAPESLGLYVFSEDIDEANYIVNTLPNGSSAINDVMAQIAPSSTPFGGFGRSGFGAYRGKASIDTFSHLQSTVTVPTSAEFETMLEWRYPYAEPDSTVDFIRQNLLAKLPES